MLIDKNFKMDIVITFLASKSQRRIQSLVKHLWYGILQEYFLFKCSASGSTVKRTLSQDVTVKLSIQKQPPKVFYNKSFFKNFAISTGKHLSWSLFLIKACNFIKKRLQHRCFSVNIAKFSTTHIVKNICKRLLQNVVYMINFFLFGANWCKLSVLLFL